MGTRPCTGQGDISAPPLPPARPHARPHARTHAPTHTSHTPGSGGTRGRGCPGTRSALWSVGQWVHSVGQWVHSVGHWVRCGSRALWERGALVAGGCVTVETAHARRKSKQRSSSVGGWGGGGTGMPAVWLACPMPHCETPNMPSAIQRDPQQCAGLIQQFGAAAGAVGGGGPAHLAALEHDVVEGLGGDDGHRAAVVLPSCKAIRQ